MNDKYSKIIDKPYAKSKRRPHMSILNRAAQFAPFAALTGFDDSIKETGKNLVKKIEISEDKINEINNILKSIKKYDLVKITYFESIKKNLGEYKIIISKILEIDENKKYIKLTDLIYIDFSNIYQINKL